MNLQRSVNALAKSSKSLNYQKLSREVQKGLVGLVECVMRATEVAHSDHREALEIFQAIGAPATLSAKPRALMPVETEFDTLVTDIKFLEKETSQTNECLRATLVATLRARASMLELFAAPKRSMLVSKAVYPRWLKLCLGFRTATKVPRPLDYRPAPDTDAHLRSWRQLTPGRETEERCRPTLGPCIRPRLRSER